jgi:hypothetical protein
MATLTVGADKQYSTLSAAVAASQDGDVIQVAAGLYVNDFATITTRITIEGVGGMVRMQATEAPPDDKAILTINTDVTIYNMEFFGAALPDSVGGNGAGIRYEGGKLVLDHTYFHDNQDGLLGADVPGGTITIKNSEFAHNGVARPGQTAGFTHNLYVGAIASLTIDNSYFHDAVVGNEIKSRALSTTITNSRIGSGPTGDDSFDIDLPNGGQALIQNNVLEKGPNSENSNFIAFGEEGANPGSSLSVTGNTVLNDTGRTATLVLDFAGVNATVIGNAISGLTDTQLYRGVGTPDILGNAFGGTEPAFGTSDPYLPPLPFEFVVCFTAGTLILSDRGELAVEQLKPGDQLVTLVHSERVARPVKWVGSRRLDAAAHPRPEDVTPIRIVRGAVAENVPHRDLLISPDHALYLDGVLVQARQLINGRTVRQETAIRPVRYFHVELDAHAVLLAEGLPAESYLDTGNRGFFANSDEPTTLHPQLPGEPQVDRLAGSCAPFRTDEPTVWPIWHRIADRAVELGYGAGTGVTTSDPELRLAVSGRTVPAAGVDGRRHVFAFRGDVTDVRLLSRAAPPTTCRPWLDDRRPLGVAIGRIVLRNAGNVVEIPLDHPALGQGWWQVEHHGGRIVRWTDGEALLPLPRLTGQVTLEIHLTGDMIYPLPSDTAGEAAFGMRA